MVGAVIVCDDKIIGEGYHQQYGGPHAEVNAINSVSAPALLKRSTLYVNLEPCCHYGKTPPCADLIIEKKIPNVVVCNRDPFPMVAGKGIEKLREAGVNVECGVMGNEGLWLNRRFFTFHTKKRPYIFLKWAQSADGFIDKIRIDAQMPQLKVSSGDSLTAMHKFRAGESAIMVGPNTAVMDNPSLTVRLAEGKQPLRILLDRDLCVPQSAKLYDGTTQTLVLTQTKPDYELPNVEFAACEFHQDGSVNLTSMFAILYQHGVESLIVEGGRLLLQSFLDNDLWDELRIETNRTLFVGNGVSAPTVDWNPEIEKHAYLDFGDNQVSYYRKSSAVLGSCLFNIKNT